MNILAVWRKNYSKRSGSSMKRTEIRALYRDTKEYAGKEITVAGWIRNLRDSKLIGIFYFF